MRRSVSLAVMALAVSLAGCSSGHVVAVEVSPASPDLPAPFLASGDAVAEAAVCESGTWEIDHFESVDGDTIADAERMAIFNSASFADDDVAEWIAVQEFVCDDGSGTFTMKWHTKITRILVESDGPEDIGTWEIEEGTGAYTELSGSGGATDVWDTNDLVFSGRVQTG